MWKLCISSTTTQPEIPTNIRQHGVLSTITDITPTTHEHFVFSEYPGYPDDQASSITPMFFSNISISSHTSLFTELAAIYILAQSLINYDPSTTDHGVQPLFHRLPIYPFWGKSGVSEGSASRTQAPRMGPPRQPGLSSRRKHSSPPASPLI